MPKPKPVPWVDEQGQMITVADVIDALVTAAGLIAREIEQSPSIKGNPVATAEYHRKLSIVNKVKQAYEMSVILTKQPTLVPVTKKKKEISH